MEEQKTTPKIKVSESHKKQDPTRNESQEEKINKKLITDYILFSSDCAENCMRNWKEVQGLYKIKLELKHLLYS